MNNKTNLLGNLIPMKKQTTQDNESNRENADPLEERDSIDSRISTMAGRSSASINRLSGASTSTQGRHQHKLKQRFTVIRKLGKGTYGKVQLAQNRETGREVAIKTIKKSKIENEQDLERVRREIQIMSSIEHPHIIHIYEVFENKDKIVLVMQYAPGGELYEYVSQSKLLDDCEARRLFRQIATAIFYCHQNKICHRDLKLENILLDEKNNAKLADFGLSNVFDKQRKLKTFCGSPLYASPEIVQGSPYEGPEVDCWSLGVLLYTLVYGAMPFDGSNFKRLVKQISEASYFEPKPRSRASPLIRRLLCADPKKRATVIDICMDPWVNGAIVSSSKVSQPQTSCNSLLQVAQDMANLTPVRLDILMALVPPTKPTATSSNAPEPVTNRAPLAERDIQNVVFPEEISLGEGAETRVASFVVRNLDDKADKEVTPEAKPEIEPEVEHVNQEPMDVETLPAEPPVESMDEQGETIELKQDQPVELEFMQLKSDSMQVDSSHQVEMKKEQDEPAKDDKNPDESVEMKVEPIATQKEDPNSSEVDRIDEARDTNVISDEAQIKAADKITDEAMECGQEPEAVSEVEVGSSRPVSELDGTISQEDGKSALSEGEKPKKMKKKIVVVKKKRKVVVGKKAKDPATADGSEPVDSINAKTKESNELSQVEAGDKQPEAKTNDKTDTNEHSTSEKPVQLENEPTATVNNEKQAASLETESILTQIEPTTCVDQQSSDKESTTTKANHIRRRSTLIADMSQKLLQQLEADALAVASSTSDQAQFIGQVRVSDKKDEYERRTSLLQTNEIEIKKRKSQDGSMNQDIENISKPTEEDSSANVVDTNVNLNETCDESQSEGMQILSQSQSETIDSIRPEVSIETVTKKHSTTVTCEAQQDEKPVRSCFEINLTAQQQQQQQRPDPQEISISESETSDPSPTALKQQQQQAITRPVPITRSYKKVTFTKDGACITETGKIYATRADDGTMRRVERKSKVTHYPAIGNAELASQAEQAASTYSECSEVLYEDRFGWPGGGLDQANQSINRHGFEKLIMPSQQEADDEFTSGNHHEDFLSAVQSPFSISGQRYDKPVHQSMMGQIDRAESLSTCSSGSLDAFDDIFDNWTGAISMFDQHQNNQNIFGSSSFAKNHGPHSDPFKVTSVFSTLRRPHKHRHSPHRVGTSVAGSPRCGSVEPQFAACQQKFRQFGPKPRISDSNQIFDARFARDHAQEFNQSRPASATAANSARVCNGTYRSDSGSGSTPANAFFTNESPPRASDRMHRDDEFFQPRISNPLDASSLMREVSRKHTLMHRQLMQRHKQLWKGSTPSLFSPTGFAEEAGFRIEPIRPPSGLSAMDNRLRQDEARASMSDPMAPPRPPSSSSSVHKSMIHQSQSSSSSKVFQPCVALDSKPTRRNTANLSEHVQNHREVTQIRRTVSKASILASQMAQMQINPEEPLVTEHSDSFVDLKRPSSTSSANVSLIESRNQEPRQQQQQQFTSMSKVMSKTRCASNQTSGTVTSVTCEGPPRNDNDSRIQNWLQESTSNLSSSSGSKSSASFSTYEGSAMKSDRSFNSLYGSMKSHRVQPTQQQSSMLPPRLPYQTFESPAQKERKYVSTTKQVILSSGSNDNQSKTISKQHEIIQYSTSEISEPLCEEPEILTETSGETATAAAAATTTTAVKTSTTSSTYSMKLNEMSQPPNEATCWPIGEILLDESQSQQSSSSLLDQLKSMGYRSMINQRMTQTTSKDTNSATILSQSSASIVQEEAMNKSTATKIVKTSTSSLTTNEPTKKGIHEQDLGSVDDRVEFEASDMHLEIQRDKSYTEECQPIDNNNNNNNNNNNHNICNSNTNLTNGLDSHQLVNENLRDESPKLGINQQDIENDIEDEDIREAKAYVKAYVDRMKETELFLKTMQEEEDEAQRLRQLQLLDDLTTAKRFNAIKCSVVSDFNFNNPYTPPKAMDNICDSVPFSNSGFHSAPVRSIQTNPMNFNPNFDEQLQTTTDPIPWSSSTTFSRSSMQPYSGRTPTFARYHQPPDSLSFASHVDHESRLGSNVLRSRISTNELGSSFRRSRPLSMSIDTYDSGFESAYPTSKRSSSQIRKRPLIGSLSPLTPDDTYMTEYQRAYGPKSATTTASSKTFGYSSSLDESNLTKKIDSSSRLETPSDDIDDSMEAYRVSSYVPKVVPQGAQTRTSRSRLRLGISSTNQNRSKLVSDWTPDKNAEMNEHDNTEPNETTKQQRRTSLQISDLYGSNESKTGSYSSRPYTDDEPSRRRSLQPASEIRDIGIDSRLSELEQRLQANKRRREELLAASKSGDQNRVESVSSMGSIDAAAKNQLADEPKESVTTSRQQEVEFQSPKQQPNHSNRLVGRPSRLESMEARIKRRSYYIRVGKETMPEQPRQTSVDRWQSRRST